MAVVVQLKSATDQRRVRLYNYKTKELKHELKFNGNATSCSYRTEVFIVIHDEQYVCDHIILLYSDYRCKR